jgi:RNA polymerase sigma-B factor
VNSSRITAHDATTRQGETNRLLRAAYDAPPSERQRLIDEVIVRNVSVARAVATRYRDRGVAVEDLIQVACVALVRAANRFDPAQADDFLTYAVPTIRGEVKRYFRDHSWAVRPPRRVQEVQGLIHKSGAALGLDGNRKDLADKLGLEQREIDAAIQAQGCFTPSSLDAPSHEGGASLGDVLVADHTDLEAAEARTMMRALIRELEPRERLILYLRFFEDRTQKEIGEEIGVTQMQVSRLIARLMDRMRERLEGGSVGGAASA